MVSTWSVFLFCIRIYPYHITRLDPYFLHLAGAHFVPLGVDQIYNIRVYVLIRVFTIKILFGISWGVYPIFGFGKLMDLSRATVIWVTTGSKGSWAGHQSPTNGS